jgi:hypothetical protein
VNAYPIIMAKERLYITHCTFKKDDTLTGTDKLVLPEELYNGTKIHRFISQCKKKGVKWAIFSDYYGVWFSNEKHTWYEKDPDDVNDNEFETLVTNSKKRLLPYCVYFYGNYKSHYFHPLYRRMVYRLKEEGVEIQLISKFEEIEG